MREERKRKALYVNRREELYPAALLQKERAPGKTRDRRGKGRRPKAVGSRSKPSR